MIMSVIASLAGGALRVSRLGAGEKKENPNLLFLSLRLYCALYLLPQAPHKNPKTVV